MSAGLRRQILAAIEGIKRQADASKLLEKDLALCPPATNSSLRILAIGKAAQPMMKAALGQLGPHIETGLCVGPSGFEHIEDRRIQCLYGDHPVPGEGSFLAGERVMDFARSAQTDGASVMVLLSGGSSSLCEWPASGLSTHEVSAVHRQCVASGQAIELMNARRSEVSALKAGGLAKLLGTSLVDVRILVDVPSGDMDVVGSGPCTSDLFHGIKRAIGIPADLIGMAQREFMSFSSHWAAPRSWDMDALSDAMIRHAEGPRGLWITAGEVKVALPPRFLNRAEGGRAQHVALSVACRIRDPGPWSIAAWASDGRDGHGGSGALITSADRPKFHDEQAAHALASWTSGSYLASVGCRLNSFASATNLTDLYMVLRP